MGKYLAQRMASDPKSPGGLAARMVGKVYEFDSQSAAVDWAQERSRKNGDCYMISYLRDPEYVTKIQEEKVRPNSRGARLSRAMQVMVRSGMTPEIAARAISSAGMEEALRFELGLYLTTEEWQAALAKHEGDALEAMEERFPEEVSV